MSLELINIIIAGDIKNSLKLIESGKYNLGKVDKYGMTALMYAAAYKKMKPVALKLIETGKSKTGQVSKEYGHTALIHACEHNIPTVALKIIETGKSKSEHVDKLGHNALYYAKKNKMPKVVKLLLL